MNKLIITAAMVCGLGLSQADAQNKNKVDVMDKHETLVSNGMKALFKNYSEAEARQFFAQDYIQHNPHVPTGLEPVIGFLPVLQQAGITYATHRVIRDGDLVALHNSYVNAEPFGASRIVTFDVFRVENGRLAEHWDAIQPMVETTASGRSQVDGSSAIRDLDKTDANKTLISNFMDDILLGKNPGKLAEYVSAEHYHQHNPQIKDGLDGLVEAITQLSAANDMFQYKTIHKVIGEGNFVLAISEGEWHGKGQAFYDLFRIEDSKIVEHWDVIQEIPIEQAHGNGMF